MRSWRFAGLAALCLIGPAAADTPSWHLTLRPADIVVGPALRGLPGGRHHWLWQFDEAGGVFDVAVRKSAVPIPAPQCRLDYLILEMPSYYPEDPRQAPLAARRAVYDAVLRLKTAGSGSLAAHVEAGYAVKQGRAGPELTACNIYFVLPLDPDAAALLP